MTGFQVLANISVWVGYPWIPLLIYGTLELGLDQRRIVQRMYEYIFVIGFISKGL